VARTMTADPSNRVPHLAFQPDAMSALPLLPMAEVESAYYLRIHAHNRAGVLAQVATMLAEYEISIEALVQKETPEADSVPIVLLLHRCREGDLEQAIARMEALPVVVQPVLRLRVESLAEG
ncbi:ACT domain-containing protein, partial [Acidithiobacillus ferrooxidans]|nr:ACT domain-containing protein [Acidithiobacillus ferrooxidans]